MTKGVRCPASSHGRYGGLTTPEGCAFLDLQLVTHAISSCVTLEVRPIVDTSSNCATPWCVLDDAVDGPVTLDGYLIMGLMYRYVTPGVCLIMETVYGCVTLDGYLKIDVPYGCITAWTYYYVRLWMYV